MINSIVRTSLRFRYMIVVAAAVLMITGFARIADTPTDVLPEFSPVVVEIQTEALGLSSAEVEQLITVPLEADLLNGVAWVESIRSESIPSVSSIKMTFLPGTDEMAARQMVQEKLTQAAGLPNVSKPPVMLQPVSSTSRVLMIGMSSNDMSLIEMSVLARWNVRPRLMGVPGVAHVSIWGQRKRQLQVLVDPDRLRKEGVPLHKVVSTTGNALWYSPLSFLNASSPGTGGFIDTPNQRLGIRHVLPIVSPEGLSKVALEGSNKRLGDVADVVESHQPLIGDAIVGKNPGILLVVEKFPWANTLEVTRGVEEALDALRPGLKGITMDSQVYRPASYIERAVGNLSSVLLIGILLMIAGLFLFFMNWRVVLVAGIAIVTSALVAWFVLFLWGGTVDGLIFTGLVMAVGVIVDDAIVEVQNYRQRLEREEDWPDREGLETRMTRVADRVRGPMGFATLAVLLSVSPFFFFDGVPDAFFSALGTGYALAVIASAVVALTLTPALSSVMLSPEREVRTSSLSRMLSGFFQGLWQRLEASRRIAYILVGLSLATLVAALMLIPAKTLLPEYQETDLLVHLNAKAGISQPEMSRITSEVVRELRGIEGVVDVGAQVGRAVTSDRVVGVNSTEVWLTVDPKMDHDGVADAVEAIVSAYPGLEQDISTYSVERVRDLMAGEDDNLTVRVYGQNLDTLSLEAQKIKDRLSGIDGIVETAVLRSPVEPTVEIRVDLEKSKRYSIKPGDVRRSAATLLSGLHVGSLFEDKKVFDVLVWGKPAIRSSVSDIKNLLLETPDGRYVRLGEVADVSVVSQPSVIRREGVAKFVDVEIDVSGRDMGEVAGEIETFLRGHALPMEYHAEVLGSYLKRQSANRYFWVSAIASVIGIFLLLQAALRSWRLALLVSCVLPVALSGGIAAILLGGTAFSLGPVLGLLAALGMAIRMAVLLVSHYQRLEREEGQAFGVDLVVRGTQEQAETILASLLVTALAVIPLLAASAGAGLEIITPMAAVILACLLTIAALLLFILPVLYLAFGAGAVDDSEYDQLREELAHEK